MGTDRLRLLRRMSDETSVCWIPIRYKTSSDVRQYLLRSVAMRADRLRLRLPRRMSDETSACWIPIRHKTSFDGEVRFCLSFDSVRSGQLLWQQTDFDFPGGCLMKLAHAGSLSDTRHRPMVKSESVRRSTVTDS